MANEVKVEAKLTFTKSGIDPVSRVNITAGGDLITQKSSGIIYVNRVQNIGTAAELIGIGDIVEIGWCWMKNIGTGIIAIRNGVAGVDVIEMEAGEMALFRAKSAASLYAIADSGAIDLEYFFIDD